VTNIDSVWVFELKTKQGNNLALPGAGFANDAVVIGKTLYVSDNRTDKLFRVEPADFLNSKKDPKITGCSPERASIPMDWQPVRMMRC
jgi:hypothetical protein